MSKPHQRQPSLYDPNPTVVGQWWHYVAALVSETGRRYGAQCTLFKFGKREFYHAALTDVSGQMHIRREVVLRDMDWRPCNEDAPGRHTVRFSLVSPRFCDLDLSFRSHEPPVTYPAELGNLHYGYPRMTVRGTLNRKERLG